MQAGTLEPHSVREVVAADTEARRISGGDLLPREVRVSLSQLRPRVLASSLVFDFGLIAVTALACEYFQNPILYVMPLPMIAFGGQWLTLISRNNVIAVAFLSALLSNLMWSQYQKGNSDERKNLEPCM